MMKIFYSKYCFQLRLWSIVLTFFLSLCSFTAMAELQFASWIPEQAQNYVDGLVKENSNLSPEAIKLANQRIQTATAEKNWSIVVSETARLAGNNPKVRDRWIILSFALLQKIKSTQDDWKSSQDAKYAVYQAYQLSATPQERAEALLLYGSLLDPESGYEQPSYLDVLTEVKTLVDLPKFRQENPKIADLMAFKFLKTRLNTDNVPPNACFLFSHPLAKSGVRYEDFVNISPKVEGAFKVNGRELCFSPLQFGGNYDVTFKAGFVSLDGEKISENFSTSFIVKDQTARLSFAAKSYVLMQNEAALVPLSGINIDVVTLKILRINDRALNQVMNGNNGRAFLESLWSYSVEQVEESQGELIWQGEMNFSNQKNQTVTKQIPFSEVVKSVKPGVYIIQAQEKGVIYGETARATQWLVVSDMGVTAFSDRDGSLLVQTRSLKSAEVMSNAEVQLIAYNNTILGKQKTGRDGIARFDSSLTGGKGGNRPVMLLIYGQKGDFTLLDLRSPAFDLSDRGVSGLPIAGPLNAFLYTEQGVYRAGDTLHLNALLRDEKGAKGHLPLTFRVLRPDGVEVDQPLTALKMADSGMTSSVLTLKGDELGHYQLTLPIPTTARTGQWSILAYTDVKKEPVGSVQFTVEDFVPSRLALLVKSAEKFLTMHTPISVDVEGRYLFGSKAVGMEGDAWLNLHVNPNPYPHFPGFNFGLLDEKWMDERLAIPFIPLDKEGKQTLTVALNKKLETTKPLEAVLRVTLRDKGGRPEQGVLKMPVVVSPYMIGLKAGFAGKTVSDTETETMIEIIALDPEGHLKAIENLEYELYFEERTYAWYQAGNNSGWQYKTLFEDKFITKGTVNTEAKGSVHLKVPVTQWGSYRLEVRDPKTQVASSIRFNKGWRSVAEGANTPDLLEITANQETYKLGDTVELKITAPFDGEAILSINNQNILETKNITVSKKGNVVKLAVKENWGTGAYCLVSAFRPLGKKAPADNDNSHLPKRAVGVAWLGVDTSAKKLNISLELPKEVLPRQSIEVPISVQSAVDKKITSLEKALSKIMVTVAAVDEGILKLTEFKLPQPEEYFFGKHQMGVELRDLYGKLIDPLPGALGELRSGGDMGILSRNLQALSKRSFKVVSLYAGTVELDKEGKGKVKLDIPDFNGQLRIMAVAFDEKRLGSKEATLLVRDPVVLEGVLPRFLAPNDRSQLAISLHNVSGTPGEYTVQAKTSGSIGLMGSELLKVTLAKEGVFESTLPIQALNIGEGRIELQLSGPGVNVTRFFEISVRPSTPYASQINSVSLKPQESSKLSEAGLEKFIPGTELISVSWSTQVPWDTSSISDTLLKYEYGCVEQTVSKGFAALFSQKPNARALLLQTFARLSEQQKAEGGFSLWQGGEQDLWLTAYVVDLLQRSLAQKEIAIPKFTLERGLQFLVQTTENRMTRDTIDLSGIAYSLYVLSKTDKVETGAIRYFYDTHYEKMNSLSLFWMGAALFNRHDFERGNKAFVRAYSKRPVISNAPVESIYGPFGSQLRDTAANIVLFKEAMAQSPTLQTWGTLESLTLVLGQEIAAAKTLSTNEAAFVLLAANAITQGQATPVNISVNGVVQAEQEKSAHAMNFTSSDLKKGVTIQNLGKGDVWQHVAFSGILKESLKAASEGFEISRRYYTLDGMPYTANTAQQGAQFIVVIEGRATDDTLPHQLLIADFLPAGLEIENVISNQGNGKTRFSWLNDVSTPQYAEPRDDRFVGAMLLNDKIREFKLAYQVRAVTPGVYVQPGLFVEDMYAPKYYARTEEKTFEVKASP